MKNYYLLFLALLLSNSIFSQDETFIITNESKTNQTAHIYEIVKKIIKTDKYEKREIPNPEYLSLTKKIDSLDNLINSLNGSEYSEKQRQSLSYAFHYLKDAIAYKSKNGGEMDIFGDKWNDIRKAKKELDKTGIEFQQTIKKKYSLAIEEANRNMEKIQNVLGLSSEKQTKIAKLESQKSDLERKINNPFNPLKKQIIADVATEKIERETLIINSENVFSSITGKFIAIKNDQYNNNYRIIKEDYKGFVKNEIVLGKTIEDNIEDAIGSLKNLNRLTDDISTYVYRDENDNSYLKYSNERYLIKNLDNGKLYLTTDNILDKVALEANSLNFINVLTENNIKVTEKNRKSYVSKNGIECVLTDYVKQEIINNNTNIIQETVSSVNQYDKYYQQAIKELEVVGKHYQSYQSKTMTESRLEKWKTDTKKLISTKEKMDNIHYGKYSNDKKSELAYQYFMNFSKQLTREQVEAGSIISDIIRECKIIIGI